MALIRCKVCGKQLSDRAKVCPHCGVKKKQKVTLRRKTSEDEESTQTVLASQSTTPPNGTQPAKPSALYTPPLETQSKAPMVIAIVLMLVLLGIGVMFFFLLNPRSHRSTTEDYADTVAAQSSGDYSWGSEGQNEQQADEGQAGAESNGNRAIDVFNAQTRNDSSSVSVVRTYSQQDDPGFSKPYDVRQFVADERYEHDDVTLEITSDGIYANGNKISTSTPVFRKLNRKYGRITAKPSISITVSYDDNALIDNSTHERYTHVY